MNKKSDKDQNQDPNSLTSEDWKVINKKDFSPSDVIDDYRPEGKIIPDKKAPEGIFKVIIGALLIFSGIIIAIVTSVSIIGIIFGVAMVIGGLILPFVNFGGAGARNRGAV